MAVTSGLKKNPDVRSALKWTVLQQHTEEGTMRNYFLPTRDFRALSIIDLLQAREAYHYHLLRMENVVATAIGLYRLRKNDPDVKAPKDYEEVREVKLETPRTLQNTIIQPWSWPCLLVFVDKWISRKEAARADPDQVVPRFLYLPDGRVIPTCVIFAEKQEETPAPLKNLNFPHEIIGGGYPVYTEDQGEQRIASIGCMVTDGLNVYGLTNRHVVGEEGRSIYSLFGGEKIRIGKSHQKQLAKKLFHDVYPGWPASRTYVSLDAGLIYVEDLGYWTAQVFGIGEIGKPIDLNMRTISLDLIGCPVRAFGCASADLKGEIKALFYRYKSIGEFEYVSDLLIGPRDEKSVLLTRPGDSGTLWFFDPELSPGEMRKAGEAGKRARRLSPIALQWGGHVLSGDNKGTQYRFALATCLSTICRELDIDVISDWNTGHSEYWGKTGHYKIAAKACELVKDKKLKTLLTSNVDAIAFDDQAITDGELKRMDAHEFVPLADVPDLVWRTLRKKDAVNHFADMDGQGKGEFEGKTLLDLCEDRRNINIEVWNKFYESLEVDAKNRGALPFRVWQIFDNMIRFVKKGEIDKFVCAGGVLSHYVADACQPLHISKLYHGYNPDDPQQNKVHGKYETDMLDRYATDILAGVNAKLQGKSAEATVKDGCDAACKTVDLMKNTITGLPPEEIIKAFNEEDGRKRIPHMFEILGDRTISCLTEGTLFLASIWASAWEKGSGEEVDETRLKPSTRPSLKKLYLNKNFLPAYYLNDEEFVAELG